jgi:hypothetical protein
MIARVSHLEAFRQWRLAEEQSIEDFIAHFGQPANEKMKAGTAFHSFLERAQEGVSYENIKIAGYTYHTNCDAALPLPQIREIRASKQYGDLTVTGKLDGQRGLAVMDYKTTAALNTERYQDGYQWRYYLDIFGADVFRWYVFVMKEVAEREYSITGFHKLEAWRYPDMEKDTQSLAQAYYEAMKPHEEEIQKMIEQREALERSEALTAEAAMPLANAAPEPDTEPAARGRYIHLPDPEEAADSPPPPPDPGPEPAPAKKRGRPKGAKAKDKEQVEGAAPSETEEQVPAPEPDTFSFRARIVEEEPDDGDGCIVSFAVDVDDSVDSVFIVPISEVLSYVPWNEEDNIYDFTLVTRAYAEQSGIMAAVEKALDPAPTEPPSDKRTYGDNVKWLKEETITYSQPLSETEKAAYADRWALLDLEIEEMEDERASISSSMKKTIDGKEQERRALAKIVRTGKEERQGRCDVLKDYNTEQMVWTLAEPPYTEVQRRKMTAEELRPTLMEFAGKNAPAPDSAPEESTPDAPAEAAPADSEEASAPADAYTPPVGESPAEDEQEAQEPYQRLPDPENGDTVDAEV